MKTADRGAYHVLSGDEGIVDGDELDIIALEGDPGDEPPDPPDHAERAKLISKKQSSLRSGDEAAVIR